MVSNSLPTYQQPTQSNKMVATHRHHAPSGIETLEGEQEDCSPSNVNVQRSVMKQVDRQPHNHHSHEQSSSSSSTSLGRPPLYEEQPRPCARQSIESRCKRRVRFHKTICNRRIPHLNNMSDRLREAIWIQPEEYMEIRNRCIVTVKKMMRGELTANDIESETHCTRGLEGKTREGALRRKEYKLDSIAAVLDEQQLQWEHDEDDDEALMEVYQVFTIPCAEMAYEAGLRDEVDVHSHLQREGEVLPSRIDVPPMAPVASTTALLPGLVEKLSTVVGFQSNRASMLQEIERNFYEESSIERRRKRAEAGAYRSRAANNSLAEQVKAYFQERSNKRDSNNSNTGKCGVLSPSNMARGDSWSSSITTKSTASVSSMWSSSPPPLVWDEESSSMSDEGSFDSFTTELSDVFHARKKRQSLLNEIEGFYVEPTIVSETPSKVTAFTKTLSTNLNPIMWVRKSRQETLRDLGRASQV